MKTEIILTEKPTLILQGFYLILIPVSIGGYLWKMNELNLDIPYVYTGGLFLLIFLIAKFKPKKNLKLTETGFEYKKGKKVIRDSWSNVKQIGIQSSQGKPYAFFIGGKDYKTDLIMFYFLELKSAHKKEKGYTDRVLQVLKEYSGITPVFSDHFLYNKNKNIEIVLWILIILITFLPIIFFFRFL